MDSTAHTETAREFVNRFSVWLDSSVMIGSLIHIIYIYIIYQLVLDLEQ